VSQKCNGLRFKARLNKSKRIKTRIPQLLEHAPPLVET
jgi:hypothetical protein